LIRPITRKDSAAVVSLAVSAGLFPPDDTAVLESMLAAYFDGGSGDGSVCVLHEEEGVPLGVAYYEPAKATDGVWYLTMIAVRHDAQGRGRGTALLRHVEGALRAADQRLLLVETSDSADFAGARAFYPKCGYEEEARVRDYWAAGEDMILFRKALGAAG